MIPTIEVLPPLKPSLSFAPASEGSDEPPCEFRSLLQYTCAPDPKRGKITCWPFERVFRRCGDYGASVEITTQVQKERDEHDAKVISGRE